MVSTMPGFPTPGLTSAALTPGRESLVDPSTGL